MRQRLIHTTFITLITLTIAFGAVQAQTRAYRVTDRQVQTLLDRLESRTSTFTTQIDRSLDNSSADGTRREDSINEFVGNFETATNDLRDNFLARRSTSDDVQEVLQRAAFINNFVRTNRRISQPAQGTWNLIRADLNTLATYYRVTSRWEDSVSTPPVQSGGYTISDFQMRNALIRLRQRNVAFRLSFDRWSRFRRTDQDATADVKQSILELDRALFSLGSNFANRRSDTVETVLSTSSTIDTYISATRTNADVAGKWDLVRSDLSMLAGYYNMSWDGGEDGNINGNANNNSSGGSQSGNFDSRLTGTYRLNMSQSDNVTTTVNRAIALANYNVNQRDRVRQNLERRLASPETLTLEKRGQQVTMSSANMQSVVLNADGVRQTETLPNGRTVNTSVIATGTDLTINYEGDRINDYYISFMPMASGQLKVTRRVFLENQNETVTVTSVYDKTSQTAQFNTVITPSPTSSGTADGFVIPNNTGLTATLDSPLSTRTARDGDPFSMTVTSPSQYNGAIIEGRVTGEKSGVVSGRANLSLNFNTIRTRDGRVYTFAGIVDQVRNTNGDVVNVNNEGQIRDRSQTTTTATRAGIGAVIGGIIGAIVGGGSGAAVGAGVGAGAGAGTVILQGRDNLDLAAGTQFTITATAPANVISQ